MHDRLRRSLAAAAWAATCALAPARSAAQESVAQIRPVSGLTLVSTLQSPEGDRDDVVELERVDSAGIHYVWRFVEIHRNGDTITDVRERRVRANDLAGAPRVDWIFAAGDDLERPGYTAWSLSSAVYVALRDQGSARFTTVWVDTAAGIIGALGGRRPPRRIRHTGTIARVSPKPAPFPLLLDGRRVTAPALHLRAALANGARAEGVDLWILADSAHPLLLKALKANNVFQVTQVNFPVESRARAGAASMAGLLEGQLEAACRVEVPGVYFAFNSALIDPASDRALAQVAAVLGRHSDWTLGVEGHTDSVGTTAANQALSERRAQAVRRRLAERHGVDTRRWTATGYGASRPREPNATIEGRARNRRVELTRACSERS